MASANEGSLKPKPPLSQQVAPKNKHRSKRHLGYWFEAMKRRRRVFPRTNESKWFQEKNNFTDEIRQAFLDHIQPLVEGYEQHAEAARKSYDTAEE
ncbi:MAG: hypothetical protein Q9218_005674 [Villophora microphyllina]